MMFCQASVNISDASQVGEARRFATRLAADAGLDENLRGKASIIATELATNIARHARQGEVLLRTTNLGDDVGLEMLAIDRGPGMVSVARCMADGYSTAGTAGNGLGAIKRLANVFDIFSTPPSGTVVLARVQKSIKPAASPPGFEWGAVSLPAPHEIFCGDTWRIAQGPAALSLMVADGLGHGEKAAESALAAADAFASNGFTSTSDFFATADRRLRGMRGAAIAVAQWNATANSVTYTGVGNIAGTLLSAAATPRRGLVSHNGTVGVEMRRVQSFEYECPELALLVMHSDGLQTRWSLDAYPGLVQRHPAIIAGVLYRDFVRGRDDVTVCVVRCVPAKAA